MREEPVKPEKYLYLQENGIDIDACKIDYKMISVRCEDLSLYRKAFRVKIRALIKQGDSASLKRYVDQFYTLAQFVQYLYGFHSCASPVEAWQEELASYLQTQFEENNVQVYRDGSWISYGSVEDYSKSFKKQYEELPFGQKLETSACVQDAKPFINLKDKAHFAKDKAFMAQYREQ